MTTAASGRWRNPSGATSSGARAARDCVAQVAAPLIEAACYLLVVVVKGARQTGADSSHPD